MQDRFDKDGLLKKEYWEPGEWHDEPDTFEMTYKGYKCEGRRNAMGSWCGYVLIPFDDPFYTDLDEEHYDEVPLEVHGGVTYGHNDEDNKWYRVGFDCAHYNDYMPSRKATFDTFGEIYPGYKKGMQEIEDKFPGMKDKWPTSGTYRNIAFVKKELRSMVNQIIKKNKLIND
jgi:hypothetical protein